MKEAKGIRKLTGNRAKAAEKILRAAVRAFEPKKLTLEILNKEVERIKSQPSDGWYRLPCLPMTQKQADHLKKMGIIYSGPIAPEYS